MGTDMRFSDKQIGTRQAERRALQEDKHPKKKLFCSPSSLRPASTATKMALR